MTETPNKIHHFMIMRIFDNGHAECLDLDDYQLVFDAYNKQVRINLSGEQSATVSNWNWRPAK
jgi:hypothetical protein